MRHPWVTYAICLALIGGYVSNTSSRGAGVEDAEARIDELVAYYERNAFVQVAPEVIGLLGGIDVEEKARLHEEEREAAGLAPMPSISRRRAQRTFEALASEALETRSLLPKWRYGVVHQQTPRENLLLHAGVHRSPLALGLVVFVVLFVGMALESAWGSLTFAAFSAAGVVAAAFAYTAAHADLGTPWIGGSGLAAAMLGAYIIPPLRGNASLPGGIPLAGWLLLPALGIVEYLVVRELWIGTFDRGPYGAHIAALAFGFAISLSFRLMGIEKRRLCNDGDSPDLVSNPVLERAMQAKAAGRAPEAFGLLQNALRANPRNHDVVLAFWDVSLDLGRVDAASRYMLGIIQDELRASQLKLAVQHWLDYTLHVASVELEPMLAIRLGEALAEEGNPEQAVRALCAALDGPKPPSSALAMRIVRVARDIDDDVTARAARLALASGVNDPAERQMLESLVTAATTAPRQRAGVDSSPLSQGRAKASSMTASSAPPVTATPTPTATATAPAPTTTASVDDRGELDPNALSIESLQDELEAAPAQPEEVDRWNAVGMVEDLSEELADDVPGPDLEIGEGDDLSADAEAEIASSLALDEGSRALRLITAVPIRLEENALVIEADAKGKSRVGFDRVEALSVAALHGLADKPVVVIDVVLNWMSLSDEPLKVVRLRSDRFDPRALVPGESSSIAALRTFVSRILAGSGATPLPDASWVEGGRFATFDDLARYHAEVLMVGDAGG